MSIEITSSVEPLDFDSPTLNAIYTQFADTLALRYASNFKFAIVNYKAFATARTLESVHPEMILNSPSRGIYMRVVKALRTWENIQGGRGAGKKMPPEEAMREWFEVLGIPKSKWFAIRQAIARRGIKPRDIQGRMMALMAPVLGDLCQSLAQDIAKGLFVPNSGKDAKGVLIK